MRKTLSLAVPHLAIKHYTDASGVEHIEVEQNVPGLRSSSEHRVLDWSQKKVESPLFGALVSQNRRVNVAELEAGWLKEGLLPESFVDGTVIHTLAQSDPEKSGDTWRMEQVRLMTAVPLSQRGHRMRLTRMVLQTWGFEHLGGAKRYVRRVFLVGAQGDAIQGRLVYDYGKYFAPAVNQD